MCLKCLKCSQQVSWQTKQNNNCIQYLQTIKCAASKTWTLNYWCSQTIIFSRLIVFRGPRDGQNRNNRSQNLHNCDSRNVSYAKKIHTTYQPSFLPHIQQILLLNLVLIISWDQTCAKYNHTVTIYDNLCLSVTLAICSRHVTIYLFSTIQCTETGRQQARHVLNDRMLTSADVTYSWGKSQNLLKQP